MNISFYTAAVGAQQQQTRLNVHANNIANVNTYGFRAKKPSFSALMTGPITGINEDLPRGVGSRLIGADTDFSQFSLLETDRHLDYAIEGKGFFGLLDPVTGEYSYTRDGSFIKSEFKVMVEPEPEETEGDTPPEALEPVEETRWYLCDGLRRFVLGADGEPIEVLDEVEMQPIGIFDFINYNGIQSMGDNRFIPVEKNGEVGLGSGKLVQGFLELSNADLANEMTRVIESQRSFQYMLRMVTTSEEIESTVNNLRS